jgi:GNAT superfamily N-acetyltransferase
MQNNSEIVTYRFLQKNEIPLLIDYRILFLKELQGEQHLDQELKLRRELSSYFNKSMNDNSFVAIIAEINTKPVGFGGMVIQHIPGNFNLINGFEGYILSMYTLPEYRKNGIAGEILNRLIIKGKEIGVGKIFLHASNDGYALYKKCGFKEPDFPVLEIHL